MLEYIKHTFKRVNFLFNNYVLHSFHDAPVSPDVTVDKHLNKMDPISRHYRSQVGRVFFTGFNSNLTTDGITIIIYS